MAHRSWISLILALFLISVAASPAAAGGWAVVTLDELPTDLVTGRPVEVGFVVLQHGRTPVEGLTPIITARNLDTNETIRFEAIPSGDTGHYSATMILPSAGEWNWEIDAFSTVLMPSLQVIPAEMPAQNIASSGPATPPGWIAFLLIAVAVGVLGISLLRRVRWGVGLAVVIAAIGIAWFLFSGMSFKAESLPAQAAAQSSGQVDGGEALFVAKGCLTCHMNGNVDPRYVVFSTEIGPDLTQFKAAPEYLRSWLSDPQAIKPDTEMPNLGLDEMEIEALINFLNQASD